MSKKNKSRTEKKPIDVADKNVRQLEPLSDEDTKAVSGGLGNHPPAC